MSSRKRNQVIEEFIEIYRSEPCLWRVKSKEYRDREKRDAAYERLVFKLQELEPDATKTSVVKKINNLRSNVRKERKKRDMSIKSGASTDVYTSKLWYLDLFDFLGDQDTPGAFMSSLDDEDGSEIDEETMKNAATPISAKLYTPSTTNYEEQFSYGNTLKSSSDIASEYMLQKMELELEQLRELHHLKVKHEEELHHRRLLQIQHEEARTSELYELQKQQMKELHDEQMKALYK